MAKDGDIQFPPGQRRDKPSFEPPPWELDQFEELAKRKQALEEAASQSEEIAEPAAQAAGGAEPGGDPEAAGPVQAAVVQADAAEGEKPELDPKHVEALMMGLRSEEPRLDKTYSRILMAVGGVSAFIGLVLATWGLVGLATPKRAGSGSAFLVGVPLLFGIGFMAGGIWVVVKSLRQQGVL